MRSALVILLIAALSPDAYNRGVSAVRAKNYDVAVDALTRAIAENPAESATYLPHFWIGIAKFNLGDFDAALREWKASEDQGVVQATPYYSQLRDWVARANSEKQRRAESGAAESKRDANAAVSKAVAAQMEAMAAGADRSDAYRTAQRKLQEALDASAKGGTDVRAYKHVAEVAAQAREMFAGAAEEARKRKAARPARAVKAVQRPAPAIVSAPAPQPAPEPPPVVESEALVAARIAVQGYRRHLIELNLPTLEAQTLDRELAAKPDDATIARVVQQVAAKEKELAKPKTIDVTAPRPDPTAQLESAYRAFAAGDFTTSDAVLTRLLESNAIGEAYLLRGCARYTQATLGRGSLDAASADFRAALKLNPALRLDRAAFSPKLVAYFDQVRQAR